MVARPAGTRRARAHTAAEKPPATAYRPRVLGVGQVLGDQLDGDRPFADGRGDPLTER